MCLGHFVLPAAFFSGTNHFAKEQAGAHRCPRPSQEGLPGRKPPLWILLDQTVWFFWT